MEESSSIHNLNDKCLLILFSLSRKGGKEYCRLLKLYEYDFSDKYSVYRYLQIEGYIRFNGSLIKGEWHSNEENPVEITHLGKNALSAGVFTSETAKKRSEQRDRLLRNISLVVSIVGGLLGFISFAYNLIINR